MSTDFWTHDPGVLLTRPLELWPTPSMSWTQKLNAMSRLVLLLTLLGVAVVGRGSALGIAVVGGITLLVVVFLYEFQYNRPLLEGLTLNEDTLKPMLANQFYASSPSNPLGNVLLNEINADPDRLAAPPSFDMGVAEDITANIKQAVQNMNPSFKDTTSALYGSMWDEFELDQSNRSFFSNACTRVQPGNQSALGQWLYGDLKYSSHLDTAEGAIARVNDSYRYILA